MKFSNLLLSLVIYHWNTNTSHAFTVSGLRSSTAFRINYDLALNMAGKSTGKKKRRRRKQPPNVSVESPEVSLPVEDVAVTNVEEEDSSLKVDANEDSTSFKFDAAEAAALGIVDAEDEDDIAPTFSEAMPPNKSKDPLPNFSELKSKQAPAKLGAIELPDIRDSMKSKKSKETEETEDEDESLIPKIKRSDIEGFKKLLEVEPNADSEQKYFQSEGYGTVSALLGEGAKSFLGIPPGPLQIGHFIGLLGITLCAFVTYPGFPLTNLPTSIRDALQGGLGMVLLINTLLAVGSVFKAGERGQSQALWAIKTLGVGGLAFDQLTQLPTLEEIEEMKNRKGKRAIRR